MWSREAEVLQARRGAVAGLPAARLLVLDLHGESVSSARAAILQVAPVPTLLVDMILDNSCGLTARQAALLSTSVHHEGSEAAASEATWTALRDWRLAAEAAVLHH